MRRIESLYSFQTKSGEETGQQKFDRQKIEG